MTYDQEAIIQQLNLYLKTKRRKMVLNHGYCHGLTLLWLYQMSEGRESWFYQVIKNIVKSNKTSFKQHENEIEIFLGQIEWLQQPEKYMPSIRQMDIDQTMEFKKVLPISGVFTPVQLGQILKNIVKENKMIALSGPSHTIGIFLRKGIFYIYNPNYPEGRAKKVKSFYRLRKEILRGLFEDYYYPKNKISLIINVIDKKITFKKRNMILHKIMHTKNYATAVCDAGLNPLFLATENHDLDLVKKLVQKEAQINRGTWDGRLPLLHASYSGYNDIATILLENGAEPDLEGREGLPLYVASKNGHRTLVYTLLNFGVNVNRPDRDGETAIFGAIESKQKEIVKLLMQNGANALHMRKNGETPMSIAIKTKQWDIVVILLFYMKYTSKNVKFLVNIRKFITNIIRYMEENDSVTQDEQRTVKKILYWMKPETINDSRYSPRFFGSANDIYIGGSFNKYNFPT